MIPKALVYDFSS